MRDSITVRCLQSIGDREIHGLSDNRPRLTAWFDEFATRASMQATPLSGQTRD